MKIGGRTSSRAGGGQDALHQRVRVTGRSTGSMSFAFHNPKSLLLLLLFLLLDVPHLCQCQTTAINSSSTSSPSRNSSALPSVVPGCGAGLDPTYTNLCDLQSLWGIVLEGLASLGFLVSAGLLVGLLIWTLWACVSSRHQHSSIGGTVASTSLFLLATAGIFGLTFSFIIGLTPQICPTRLFLFGVLFSLAVSCLLARCLALLGFAAARGWGEPALALGLFTVQVIIATQWLILVLLRDNKPCQYSQEEFVMLLIYVLCLLTISLIFSLHLLCRSCLTYSYGYSGSCHPQGQVQATLLCLTLLLSACIWVAWIVLLIIGNRKLGRRPQWDDPVLSVALVANGWVLLLGHGLAHVAFLCRGESKSKDSPLSFAGWTSPSTDIPGLSSPKEGRENGSFENDGGNGKGRRTEVALQSPYQSEFSMTEIDPDRDYTIPRPQTTNTREPYDRYYQHH
ncbi:retinoic acid-induced protein 3 [Genypterus blacodes]|uniref:retinoic acid-induced protein 3 n=1 Tax=Genypterus blacodes TaxID=154954 RepID=UPI003F75A2E2